MAVLVVPSPLAASPGLAEDLEQYHVWLGTACVIGLYVVAALWHHLIRRDDTLRRML
jgi:cytochrome b561